MQPNTCVALPPWAEFAAADFAARLEQPLAVGTFRREIRPLGRALIEQANARVRALAHRMLQDFPGVGRWDQTDDVLNQALVRLHRSLASVQPDSPRHFLNLAAAQVRSVLIDLARKYAGPQGLGANHESRGGQSASGGTARFVDTTEPGDYAEWAEFHECVESLPEAERELFGLLWYDGLSQAEAAEVLDRFGAK